jgi:OmpA-OmpF porin, OOP family
MPINARNPKSLLLLAALAGAAPAGFAAQAQDAPAPGLAVDVTDSRPTDATKAAKGPQIDGIISARKGNAVQVTAADGTNTVVTVTDSTKIKSSGGFLGLKRSKLDDAALLNGLPVSVDTLQWDGGLVASQIELKSKDLKTAAMIRSGTDQRFGEQTAATDALRSRMGDIDKYNVKSTTNVNFATGKSALSAQAKAELCTAASQAEAMDNALLLVVGYTDSTGSQELNQTLSEKRASAVINYLQQACKWKPYRVLTPTGMAEADPLADNTTPEGKAQNRRVAVNVLVSKAVDGLQEARVN